MQYLSIEALAGILDNTGDYIPYPDERDTYEWILKRSSAIRMPPAGTALFCLALLGGDVPSFQNFCAFIGQTYDENPPLKETVALYEKHREELTLP